MNGTHFCVQQFTLKLAEYALRSPLGATLGVPQGYRRGTAGVPRGYPGATPVVSRTYPGVYLSLPRGWGYLPWGTRFRFQPVQVLTGSGPDRFVCHA